ncbi:MAG: SLBB domain-containing protein [Gallionella sp.]|jgi:protein involved in polysaccharide export with SLBB domain
MFISKNGLRFAFGLLLSLSLSNVWSVGLGIGGAAGVVSDYSGMLGSMMPSPVLAGDGRADAAVNSSESNAKQAGDIVNNAKNQYQSDTREQLAKIDPAVYKSEFQTFVAQSVGNNLPMYGFGLFQNAPTTFAPVDNVPVTPDYVVGPGDELIVRVWGQVEANQSLLVDRNGLINLPKIGSISVAGVSYQKLSEHIGDAISRKFSNFEIDVSMGKLRSIQILVVGQAARPGNYTVSSLSTLINAVFASGGPSAKGSMRHIQLKRGNKVITDFDLYDLLINGDKSRDVKLLPGDVIYIPPVGAMAAVSGSVNTPAIFELKGGESLSDLLELAGGLTNVAAGKKVAVERIFDHEMRKVDEFMLDKAGLAKAMHDGDLVKVGTISSRFDNAVTLRGNIAGPGRHQWKEGVRISDIIPDKGALIVESYWEKKNKTSRSETGGADKLRNEVKHSLAEVNWDYAVIERLNPKDLTSSLIPFNLGKAVIDHDPAQDLLLQAGDVITIFSKDDIQVPTAKRTKYVVLEGELANPGIYQVQPGETLRQLIAREGGVSAQADLFSSEFTREATRQMQQKRLNEMVDRMEENVQRSAGKTVSGSLSAQDVEAVKVQALSQQALIAKMRQVKATGRIVMGIPEQSSQVKDLPDIALEDGDRFYVPAPSSTVSVMGMVYNQNSFLYRQGQSVGDYLGKSGGPTRDGDEDDIYLVRADGSVLSKRQGGSIFSGFAGREAMPGDTIVVGEKLEHFNFTKEIRDWTQIFYQFALGVAGGKAAKMW